MFIVRDHEYSECVGCGRKIQASDKQRTLVVLHLPAFTLLLANVFQSPNTQNAAEEG